MTGTPDSSLSGHPDDILVPLRTKEINLLLNLLGAEYERVRKSKAKSWMPATKAMHMSDLAGLQHKIVASESYQREATK